MSPTLEHAILRHAERYRALPPAGRAALRRQYLLLLKEAARGRVPEPVIRAELRYQRGVMAGFREGRQTEC
ncbi:MAG TPA: hypothetical protein VF170_02180 [Planctomycetaceae bacterium]